MSVLSALGQFLGYSAGSVNGSAINYRQDVRRRATPAELPPRALYDTLKTLYLSNGAYDELRIGWSAMGYAPSSLKAIRNPVAAVVDVLGSKIYPEPLVVITPLTADVTSQEERAHLEARDPIKAAVERFHTWSNWSRARRKHARWAALYGEAWGKVIADPLAGRVYFELIEPQVITDYTLDVRDYVTMVRLDVPQIDEQASGRRFWTHTEVWDRDRGSVRIWRTDGDASIRRLEDLGLPEETPLAAFGIDFVPLVRTPFREIDDGRAIGAVQLALEAVISTDLAATNLDAILFQDLEGVTVLRSEGTDAAGRPLPAPVVAASTTRTDARGREIGGNGQNVDGTVTIGKRAFLRLPGNQKFEHAIPPIDYAAALAILQDKDTHLERLMPALSYVRISELSGGDLSGKAITYKMRAFQDQVAEARSNALASLKQADMMALTMGAAVGIFTDLGGTFESGGFEHDFAEQPILPTSSIDDAEERRTLGQAAQAYAAASVPLGVILTDVLEKTEQEAAEVLAMATQAVDQQAQQPVVGR